MLALATQVRSSPPQGVITQTTGAMTPPQLLQPPQPLQPLQPLQPPQPAPLQPSQLPQRLQPSDLQVLSHRPFQTPVMITAAVPGAPHDETPNVR